MIPLINFFCLGALIGESFNLVLLLDLKIQIFPYKNLDLNFDSPRNWRVCTCSQVTRGKRFNFKKFVLKTTSLGHFIGIGTTRGSCIMKEVVQGSLIVHTCTNPPLPLLSKAVGMVNINLLIGLNYVVQLEGPLMQIEKVLINDCLTVSNIS